MALYDDVLGDRLIYSAKDVQNIIDKSKSETKKKTKAAWQRGFIKGTVRTAIISALIAIILALIVSLAQKVTFDNKVAHAVENCGNPYTIGIVEDSRRSYRQPGTNNVAVDIETYAIGEHLAAIAKTGDMQAFQQELYRTYYEVCRTSRFGDAEIRKVMDSILSRVASLSKNADGVPAVDFDSFADCVSSLGCTKEADGKTVADYSEYNKKWEEYFASLSEIEEITDGMNLGGR